MPACILKELAPQIAPFWEIIFTKSLSEAKVQDWKLANVPPILKIGNGHDPGNYLPTSLTSLSCKIFEHIIVSTIMTYLDNRNFFHDNQHSFWKGRSCETQLTLFLRDILKASDSKTKVDAIFLDFKMAFNKVPHKKLILKLQSWGVNEKTLECQKTKSNN
jgi:sarcosine oxidase/L-pipecolate oxidase